MSYSYCQSSDQETTQEAPSQEAPAQSGPGNAANCEEGGFLGGLAAKAMDLTGPMADVILDCMPLSKAMELAAPVIDNPIVQKWAEGIDIGTAIDQLGSAATDKLLALWPVGTGVDAEGELAGRVVGGGSVLGKVKAIRSGPQSVQFDADLFAGLDATVGEGAVVTNAFDDQVAGAIAEAGLRIGLSSTNHGVANLDILQVLQSAADLKAFSVLQILLGQLPGAGLLDMGVEPDSLLQSFINQLEGVEWTREEAIEVGASAQASAGGASAEDLQNMFPTSLPVLGALIEGIAPYLQVSSEYTTRVLPAGFPLVTYEHIGQLSGLGQLLTGHTGLSGILDEETIAKLSVPAAGEIGIMLSYDCIIAPAVATVDPSSALVTLSNTSEVGQMSEIDGVQIPLLELPQYLMAGGDLDEILAAGAAPTLTRSVSIDVPLARLTDIFPGWAETLIAQSGGGLPMEQVLQLQGTATLPGEALMCLQGRGIQLPAMGLALLSLTEIAGAAIGQSMGHGQAAVPEWLSGHEDALSTMATQVQMPEARLIGHIHLGAGGGIEGAAAVDVAGEARAEGGLAVDKTVEGPQAKQVLHALSGQKAA
jgi:hypothetical protein